MAALDDSQENLLQARRCQLEPVDPGAAVEERPEHLLRGVAGRKSEHVSGAVPPRRQHAVNRLGVLVARDEDLAAGRSDA